LRRPRPIPGGGSPELPATIPPPKPPYSARLSFIPNFTLPSSHTHRPNPLVHFILRTIFNHGTALVGTSAHCGFRGLSNSKKPTLSFATANASAGPHHRRSMTNPQHFYESHRSSNYPSDPPPAWLPSRRRTHSPKCTRDAARPQPARAARAGRGDRYVHPRHAQSLRELTDIQLIR
jgi:hypothetical protein